MIESKPRTIVIDNDKRHLDALLTGLTSAGISCLPFQFTGAFPTAEMVSGCRVIFCDLHLNDIPGGANAVPELAAIASFLMESIGKDHGPYLLVLWSRDGEWMDQMEAYIEDLDSYQRPIRCIHLDKHDHINMDTGAVNDLSGLHQALIDALQTLPSIQTLLEIESLITAAVSSTVGQIYSLADPVLLKVATRGEAVAKLLGALAEASSGRLNAAKDPWSAITEAVTPLVSDTLRRTPPAQFDAGFWAQAVDVEDLKRGTTNQSAAALNTMLNLDRQKANLDEASRGAVCKLPENWSVSARFGIKKAELFKLYGILQPNLLAEPDWRVIQIDAACDFAQSKPGVVPYILALILPRPFANNSKKASSTSPPALWRSPWFAFEGEIFQLRAHPRMILGYKPWYARKYLKLTFRIRDQLLEDIVFNARTYAARPGFISVNR